MDFDYKLSQRIDALIIKLEAARSPFMRAIWRWCLRQCWAQIPAEVVR